MSDKVQTLDVAALLAKNPKAASVFKNNRKKLGNAQRRPRPPNEYKLGLPYERLLASTAPVGAKRDLK